jgi:hypothetical protein
MTRRRHSGGGRLEIPRAERESPAANRSPPTSDQRERPSKKWRATWKLRLYRSGHRGLQRARLRPWLDYYWCEVLHTVTPPLTLSDWDTDSIALAEVGAAGGDAWLRQLDPRPGVDFAQRWQAGCRCFAAALVQENVHENVQGSVRRCVGYVWVAPGPCRHVGRRGCDWHIPAGSAWIFDAFTHPLVPGTYPDLIRTANRYLLRDGITSLLGQVEFDNLASRRVHRALSARRLGWVASLHLAGLSLHLDHRPGAWSLRWGHTPVRLELFLGPSGTAPVIQQQAA